MKTLLPGTEVVARGLRWEVVFIEPAGEQQLFRLRCLADSFRGMELDLLSPFEIIEPVASDMDPKRAANLAHWRLYHQAFLLEQALGPHALLAAKPGRLEIVPYQLVPVMRCLRMSRPRLLLADGVGLGKTIEAGLILAELIARRRAHRVLIVSPAGPLLHQWRREMRERFGLRFAVLDRDKLTEIRYQQELGANPFDHEALGLVSIDFAKQEKVLQDLERTQYDVVVIDEAHHCVSLGATGDREDSQRRRLAELLARRADGLLLLTATPHDGYDPHFASLMELLDPSLVDGKGTLRGETYRRHVVRRLKRHIKKPGTNEPMFRERRVSPHAVPLDAEATPSFVAFQRALVALTAPQIRRAVRKRRFGDVLAFVALLKRSVSTVQACRNTLEVVANRLDELDRQGVEAAEARKQRIRTLREYRKRLDRFGFLSSEEEEDYAGLEAEDIAAELLEHGAEELLDRLGYLQRAARREKRQRKTLSETRQGLRELIALADEARKEDPKLAALVAHAREIRAAEPDTNILVYTEYTDSQEQAVSALRAAIERKQLDGEVVQISGSDGEAHRIATVERFKEIDNLILVSTDATAEGLDLHVRCHHLIHLELPYNPNRLEQRNGRIDRFGQRFDPQVRYLYLEGTFEERLLLRLIQKYERQRARLTFVPNTLGGLSSDDSSTRLLEGIANDEGLELFARAGRQVSFDEDVAEEDESGSDAYRELLAEVDRAFDGFQKAAKTNLWLGDQGVHAEPEAAEDAHQACLAGIRVGVIDIVDFVLDAVRSESARGAVSQKKDETWTLKLAPQWRYGLEELPGYDVELGHLRVTTSMRQTHDDDGHAVGYLGRAHPIVRRALDRVRNVQFGSGKEALDRRVSAASFAGEQPEILYTFLGRVMSEAGREFERVVAVRASQDGQMLPMSEYADWSDLASLELAMPTRGVWESQFQGWAPKTTQTAKASADEVFGGLATSFREEHTGALAQERLELNKWLRDRSRQLCGLPIVDVQQDLFAVNNTTEDLAVWKTMTDSAERLAAFALDKTVSIALRTEAQTVLSLHVRRSNGLDRRATLSEPQVSPLGLLMLVPR